MMYIHTIRELITDLSGEWATGLYRMPEQMADATLWDLPSCYTHAAFRDCVLSGILEIDQVDENAEPLVEPVWDRMARGSLDYGLVIFSKIGRYQIHIHVYGLAKDGGYHAECVFSSFRSEHQLPMENEYFSSRITKWCEAMAQLAECSGALRATIDDRYEFWSRTSQH